MSGEASWAAVVCMRVADAGEPTQYVERGGVQANCSVCDALVWMSPAGQQVQMRTNARALCLPCARQVPASRSQPIIAEEIVADLARTGITKEQVKQRAERAFGRPVIGEEEL